MKDYMEKVGQESYSENICAPQSLPLHGLGMLGALSLLPLFPSTLLPCCPLVIEIMLECYLTLGYLVCPR